MVEGIASVQKCLLSIIFIKVFIFVLVHFQEGPHCALNEEEFYDAMEIGLERQEEQDEIVSL